MPKLLSHLHFNWSECLPSLYRRYLCTTHIKGSWNEAPTCDQHKVLEARNECSPKEKNCFRTTIDCPTMEWPKCSAPDMKPSTNLTCCHADSLTNNACEKSARKISIFKGEEKPLKSMWESANLIKQCPNENQRMDVTHYKLSNKMERLYTKTWKSCKPIVQKRKICAIDVMAIWPPIEKRLTRERPHTAKEEDTERLKINYDSLKKCLHNAIDNTKTKRKTKCCKLIMPSCGKVAQNIKCHRNRLQSACIRECCPHPSFSECDHPSLKQASAIECRCAQLVNQCEANRYLTRKKFFQLPPPLPAWPPNERPK